MQRATADRDFEALIEAAAEIGNRLHRYIDVHNRIFKTSLRHIIPIPRIFKPINYQQHFESLSFIKQELESVLRDIAASPLATNEFAVTLLAYGSALRDAIIQLGEMCGSLFQKADGTLDYLKADYDRDFKEYRDRIARYQFLGASVNAYLGR